MEYVEEKVELHGRGKGGDPDDSSAYSKKNKLFYF